MNPLARIRAFAGSDEVRFLRILGGASRPLAIAWWACALLRGVLPAIFAIAMGVTVGAVSDGDSLAVPLTVIGIVFIAMQMLPPIHIAISANLGTTLSGWLNDRLGRACVSPPGIAHLERGDLTNDVTMARDFDLGISGPPLSISMDFIATGLVQLISGLAAAIVLLRYQWWAPIVLAAAWIATHPLLRESTVWFDRRTEEVLDAERHADYAYRLAVDAPAAKEIRLFGLAPWVIDRFTNRRKRLFELQWRATRMRERPLLWALLIVVGANAAVFAALAHDAYAGNISLAATIVFAQTAVGTSALAVGGFSWALAGAAQPVASIERIEAAMPKFGALPPGSREAAGMPAREVRFRDVHFAYPGSERPVFDGFDLAIPAGSSLAIVGQNGAGKTTLAKLLCRLYDPQAGGIEIDGVDLREFDVASWRSRVTAVFQDFVRYELPLRDNVAPLGATDAAVVASLERAGASALATLDTPMSRAYDGGTDLSGGQWQRIALARALCAVTEGASLVILDEPTAQLDVRGEAEIFERVLAATRDCTTILISHRFSTVRLADRICVVEHGRVVELGSHDELMARGGRYRTMFDLQAARFGEESEDEEETLESLA